VSTCPECLRHPAALLKGASLCVFHFQLLAQARRSDDPRLRPVAPVICLAADRPI